MDKKAVLFSEMTPDQAWEAEFNAWYDEEHIPIRMKAPGFTGAQRYRRVDGPDYLAIYDMTTAGALATPEYQTIKGQPSERTSRMLRDVQGFTRYIGEEIDCVARARVRRLVCAGSHPYPAQMQRLVDGAALQDSRRVTGTMEPPGLALSGIDLRSGLA